MSGFYFCKDKKTLIKRALIIVVGITFVVIGLYRGDYNDVLNKAIRICYECIGIG